MIRTNDLTPEDAALTPTPLETNQQAQQLAGDMSEPGDHPSLLLDVLAAPFRGAEDAVRSAYNGIDMLTADLLPDYNGDKKSNFLGKSATSAGSAVEGISEFLTAFIPVIGPAGKAAKAIGLAGRAAEIAAGVGAGAFADFAAFDGHEERLSNLIQKYPALQNPITEFLSADPNDGDATARFKNVLEGAALGGLVEPLTHALRAMTSVRGAKAGVVALDAAKATVKQSEAAVAAGVKKATLDQAEESFTKTLKDKPELGPLAEKLAKISDEEIAAGGLFQDPVKELGRFVDAPEDIVTLAKAMSRKQMADEAAAGLVTGESIAVRNQKEASLVGELLDLPAQQAADIALSNTKDLTEATYLMGATRKLMLIQAKRVSELAGFVARSEAAPGFRTAEQTALEAVRAQQTLATLVLSSRQNGTQVGRALNAIRYTKYAEVESLTLARQALDNLGGSKFVNAELNKLVEAGRVADPNDAAKAVIDLTKKQVSLGDRLLRVHNEYWVNALLSGTKTSVVNTLGNTMATMIQPLEGAIGALVNKDAAGVAGSLKQYVYMKEALSDSMRFFFQAIRDGENVLVPGSAVKDTGSRSAIDASLLLREGTASRGIRAEAAGLVSGDGNGLSHLVNFIGETVRLPSRFLMGTDEFFKQLNYRSAAKSELYYRGRSKGLTGEALASFVQDNFSRVVTQGGAALSEDAVIREGMKAAEAAGLQGKAYSDYLRDYVAKNFDATRSALAENFDVTALAKDVAEEATFTRPLGPLGAATQRWAQAHPIHQLLIPFVRTPLNIVKYFGQRGLGALTFMPGVGRLQARNLADLTSTVPLVRSRAMGRIAMGSALVSTAGIAALEGRITGGGPKDEAEKKTLMQTGWQPYSFVFHSAEGPVYVSYQRMDPLASFFGLVADWSEQAKRQDPMHADALEATLNAMATAVSNNITNKTYLSSLAQVIDAVNQPDRKFATFARARVASYVPSVLAQWNSTLDHGQEMREVRSFFDAAANRIPGAQGMLEVKRNALGEPVDAVLANTPMSWLNPFTVSPRKGDPVFEELAKFNHGIQPPSPVVQGDVNLLNYRGEDGRTAYDHWLEKVGQVELQGRTLRETLGRLIKDPSYKKLAETSPGDGLDTPRLSAVKRVISSYRQAALYQIQREIPQVRQALGHASEAKAALRRGDRAKALQSVQAIIASAQ